MLFVAWGIAAAITFALKPKQAWTVLLGATSLALCTLVLFDLLLLRTGIPAWIAASDWTLVSVDMVLLALAGGLAWAARRVHRHRPRIRPARGERRGGRAGIAFQAMPAV